MNELIPFWVGALNIVIGFIGGAVWGIWIHGEYLKFKNKP